MSFVRLKTPINRKRLDKPYIKGIMYGIVIGASISKILFDVYYRYHTGFWLGIIGFLLGIYFAVIGGDKLE